MNNNEKFTVSEAMRCSMSRTDNTFKECWNEIKRLDTEDSVSVRIMKFHSAIVELLLLSRHVLLDIAMNQIHTSIMPLLNAKERAELDRTTLVDVLHNITGNEKEHKDEQ
jgi:hypothetical protein